MNRVQTIILAGAFIALALLGAKVFVYSDLHGPYLRAEILSLPSTPGTAQTAHVRLQQGADTGKVVAADIGLAPGSFDPAPPQYSVGDDVLVTEGANLGGSRTYAVLDHYRLPVAYWLLVSIFALAVIFAGWRGAGSLLGLLLSAGVLVGFVIPQVINGRSPYVVTAVGLMVISCIGIFVAHGFSKRTGLALLATYATLVFAVLLATIVVRAMHLSGVTDDSSFYLSQAKPHINMQGLLLCGILVSLIGVLDDITVGQVASIDELYHANPDFSVRNIYRSGLNIGREHIASLINTLLLVFIGTSFLLVTYLSALSPYPWFINLNSPLIMQEVIRGLVGSVALILAVPIATFLGSRFLRPRHDRACDAAQVPPR